MTILNSSSQIKHKVYLTPSVIHTLLFLNALVLVFSDLVFGRTLLIFLAISANVAIFILQKGAKVPKYIYLGIGLTLYLSFRQILLYFSGESRFYSESFSAILFISYAVSFSLHLSNIKSQNALLVGRIFIYLNFVFGIPDFFGLNILFLHVEQNEIFRFRGLATESNLLALPLLIILYALIRKEENYKFKQLDILVCIAMIYFTYSKAAYIGVIMILTSSFIFERFRAKYVLKYGIGLSIVILLFYLLNGHDYLYLIPFYNNFLAILDLNLILSFGINDYISSLAAFDQFQAGSLGTRLATAVASIHTIFNDSLNFIFGVGGGNSYPFLIDYIFENGLDNYELNLHLVSNPEFITDKTYALKFIAEYGFAGFIILMFFYLRTAATLRSFESIGWSQFSLLLAFFMLLTQSQFIFLFLLIALLILDPPSNRPLKKSPGTGPAVGIM